MIIGIVGTPGSGKQTFAEHLKSAHGFEIIWLDDPDFFLPPVEESIEEEKSTEEEKSIESGGATDESRQAKLLRVFRYCTA